MSNSPAGLPSGIVPPLETYLRTAYELTRAEQGRRATNWRSPLFTFVRYAKGHPKLENLDGLVAANRVEEELERWCRRTYRRRDVATDQDDPWLHCFGGISDDPKAEFISTWDRVRLPAGRGILDAALAGARRFPLKPVHSYSRQYALFVAFCLQLQHLRGDAPIALPIEVLAKQLGCKVATMSNYRRWAERDGILEKTAEYSRAERRASEFRFRSDLFDENGNQTSQSNCNQNSQNEQSQQTKQDFTELPDETRMHRIPQELSPCRTSMFQPRPVKSDDDYFAERKQELNRQAQILRERKSVDNLSR